MLADALWRFHFAVVLCVVGGFIGQFFVPGVARYELVLIGVVLVSQFAWFGKCPSTELEHYLRKQADPAYRKPEDGCIAEAVRKATGVRIKDGLISIAGILILVGTIALYFLSGG